MDDMTFLRADAVSQDELVAAFNHAFEGYLVPMRHTADSLAAMMSSNDVRLAESVLLRGSDGETAGVALLGVRGERGWVAGMAIAPEWRGRGIGATVMGKLIDNAHSLGLRTLQLEVLTQNAPAVRLYTRLGFRIVRPLDVFTGALTLPVAPPPHETTAPIAVTAALASYTAFHAVPAPWQRERESLEHIADRLRGLSLRDTHGLRAYLLYTPAPTAYPVLDFGSRAPTQEERARDGVVLFQRLVANDPELPVRAINVAPSDALGDALRMLHCQVSATQHEMEMDII